MNTEEQVMMEKAEELVGLMEDWASQYTFIRTVRLFSVAQLATRVLPDASLENLLLIAKLILLIFGIDDIADERLITLQDLESKVESWYSIAQGSNTATSDEMEKVLLEVRQYLSRFPLFDISSPLRNYWATSVRGLIQSMVQEYKYGLQYTANGEYPPLENALRHGVYSLGFPLWASTVLIILDEPLPEQFELTNEAINCAGAAIRLYNDLRTLDKELDEGNINSVVIAYHEFESETATAWTQAIRYVLQLADSYAQRVRELARQISQEFGQALYRIVKFNRHLYIDTGQDYHLLGAE